MKVNNNPLVSLFTCSHILQCIFTLFSSAEVKIRLISRWTSRHNVLSGMVFNHVCKLVLANNA